MIHLYMGVGFNARAGTGLTSVSESALPTHHKAPQSPQSPQSDWSFTDDERSPRTYLFSLLLSITPRMATYHYVWLHVMRICCANILLHNMFTLTLFRVCLEQQKPALAASAAPSSSGRAASASSDGAERAQGVWEGASGRPSKRSARRGPGLFDDARLCLHSQRTCYIYCIIDLIYYNIVHEWWLCSCDCEVLYRHRHRHRYRWSVYVTADCTDMFLSTPQPTRPRTGAPSR